MTKFVLRKISSELYLSFATPDDKRDEPYIGEYAFRPYNPISIARFSSRVEALEALEALENAEQHQSRNLDVELVEVFPAEF